MDESTPSPRLFQWFMSEGLYVHNPRLIVHILAIFTKPSKLLGTHQGSVVASNLLRSKYKGFLQQEQPLETFLPDRRSCQAACCCTEELSGL